MKHSIKYADMARLADYKDILYQTPRLIYLFFELTDACNLSCIHCGSDACPQNHTYLPAESAIALMNSLADRYLPRQTMICLSGGEPLLHPQFFEIAAYAAQLGFPCGITTNGTLIDQDTAKRILKSGIRSVTFSLDGLESSHDWFRNKPGSYARTVQGIRNLVRETRGDISIQITTVIHKKNFHELDEICSHVLRLGVDSWRIVNLEPIGRALQRKDLLLDGPQLRALLEYIRKKRFDPNIPIDVTYGCSHYLTTDFEHEVRDNYFICGAGIYVASILCNGDIYACMDIERRPELVQGNIFQDDFADVWQNRFREFRRNRADECTICRQCSDRNYCRGDAAHTWDYDRKQPMLCLKQLFSETED